MTKPINPCIRHDGKHQQGYCHVITAKSIEEDAISRVQDSGYLSLRNWLSEIITDYALGQVAAALMQAQKSLHTKACTDKWCGCENHKIKSAEDDCKWDVGGCEL